LRTAIKEQGPEIIILDSLHDTFAGDEIKRSHARQFVNSLASIAREQHGVVMVNMHPSLTGRNTGTGEAGSTAWRNASRAMLFFTSPKEGEDDTDRDARILKTMKANRGPSGGKIRLRWQDGVFVADEERRPTGIVEAIEIDRDLMAGLRTLVENGALVPADPKAPKGFANAVRDLSTCKRYGWGTICAAQTRLLANGKISRVELGPPSKRRVYVRPADMTYPGELKEATK